MPSASFARRTTSEPDLFSSKSNSYIRKKSQLHSNALSSAARRLLIQPQNEEVKSLRQNNVLVQHVKSWMQPNSLNTSLEILRLFESLKQLVKIMHYSFATILWPMMMYVERYVHKTRLIEDFELFPLLVVGATVAMKMWEDYGPDLDLTSYVSGITKREIRLMEFILLEKLDYTLFLNETDIENFKVLPPTASRFAQPLSPVPAWIVVDSGSIGADVLSAFTPVLLPREACSTTIDRPLLDLFMMPQATVITNSGPLFFDIRTYGAQCVA